MSLLKGLFLLITASVAAMPLDTPSQVSRPLLRDLAAKATAADLAQLVAQSGYSGGFVVPLPQQKEEVLTRLAGTRGQLLERSAFGLWLDSELGTTDWGPLQSRSLGEVDDALAEFAREHAQQWQFARGGNSKIRMLKFKGASACSTRLARTTGVAVGGRDLISTISAILQTATGASVPRGFVGSCIGSNQFVEQPIAVPGGGTLEESLNNAVSAFGSSVWIAVESRSGMCSVGVIQRAMNGGICTTAITDNILTK